MTFFGGQYWGGSSGEGGGGSFPALTNSTTAESIRDRLIAVIEGLTPDIGPDVRFRKYRNEGGANFEKWAEEHPVASRRRFQVRDIGNVEPPPVSNTDYDERFVTFRVLIAYPQNHRDGGDNALDRDDTSDSDKRQIEYATGFTGRGNFSIDNGYPDACCTEWQVEERIVGTAVDLVSIRITFRYLRALGA